ncbi:hypothetical protein SAMN05421742_1221, partial [Roseospirillum parvum]
MIQTSKRQGSLLMARFDLTDKEWEI